MNESINIMDQDKSDQRVEKIEHTLFFSFPNILGLLLCLPVLFGVLMSFDAPGSGKNLGHWVFVLLTVPFGPLCLVGLISKKRRHWGWIGYGLVFMGLFVFMIGNG